MLNDITPVILTFNEQQNIARTLSQLSWATDIVVVDSGSTDSTREILRDFENVRVFERVFDTHATQWNYAMTDTEIKSDWVLALDADYVLSRELVEEIRAINPSSETIGYLVKFSYCIAGKPLRGSLYPPVNVLFRKDAANFIQDGHTHRVKLAGSFDKLNSVIFHDDRKPLKHWIKSQKNYAALEAELISSSPFSKLDWPDRIRKFIIFAPILAPLYALFAKGVVINGVRGLRYAGERFIAEFLLSLNLLEKLFKK